MQHGIVNIWSLCQRKTEKRTTGFCGKEPVEAGSLIIEDFGYPAAVVTRNVILGTTLRSFVCFVSSFPFLSVLL